MILKLAAASAAAYGLYRLITQRSEDSDQIQPVVARTTVPTTPSGTPLGRGGPYVSPV